MQKNDDPTIVVIDRRMFDVLMEFADAGNNEMGGDGSRMRRLREHLRKFNKSLRDERQAEIKAERDALHATKQRIRDLINNYGQHTFKHVYYQYQTGVYVKCNLVGWPLKDSPKHFVRLHMPPVGRGIGQLISDCWGWQCDDVNVHYVTPDLPEGFVLATDGYWKGCYLAPTKIDPNPNKPQTLADYLGGGYVTLKVETFKPDYDSFVD